MLESGETDLFSYVKENYGIELEDFTDEEKKAVCEFLGHLSTIKDRREKFKYLCEQSNHPKFSAFLDCVPYKRFKEYVIRLGLDACRAMSYNIGDMNKKLNVESFNKNDIKVKVFELFEVGKSYSKASIKSILSDLYKELDYKATAKASDLEEYFEIKRCFMPEGDKRVNGFKILGKK